MKLRRALLAGWFRSPPLSMATRPSDGGVTSSGSPGAVGALDPAKPVPADVDPAISERYSVMEVLDLAPPDARYLAERRDTGTLVELRVLSGHFAADRVLTAALSQQSTVIARVSSRSPGIATVYECARVGSGAFVLASERPDGPTLRQVIRRDGTLGRDRAIRLAVEIAKRLESVHNLALVHGGLRPDNVVLVGSDERVVLTQLGFDWLIFSRSHGGGDGTASTRGFGAYQAPEQAFDQATPRSDVYALGAILYEMLAGTPPSTGTRFRRCRPESLRKRRADITATLDRVIMRTLEVQPDRRPAGISALCNDLWAELNAGEGERVVRHGDGVTRARPAPAGAGQRLHARAMALARMVGSLGHRLARRREERAAVQATARSSEEPPRAPGPATGRNFWAVVFPLSRYAPGLKVRRGGASNSSRMKHAMAWGGFAVVAAVTVWLTHARLTSHTSTPPQLVIPPASIATPILNERENRPGADTANGAASPGSVSGQYASVPTAAKRPVHHGDGQKTDADPSSLPTVTTPDRIEPIGPSSVDAEPPPARRAGAALRQRRQVPAAPERSVSRETGEATEEDPGAIIDWLLSGVPAQRR